MTAEPTARPGAQVSPLSVVADIVRMGEACIVEEFCIVGRHTARTSSGPSRPTVIGAGSTLHSHTVVYAGSTIGARFHTGHHVLVRENNIIGDDVSIGSLSVVEHTVTIGNKVRIHSQTFIPEFTVLDEGAWIGPRVTVTNHPLPECPQPAGCMVGVHIGPYARIGANVTLLPGVRIGARAHRCRRGRDPRRPTRRGGGREPRPDDQVHSRSALPRRPRPPTISTHRPTRVTRCQ